MSGCTGNCWKGERTCDCELQDLRWLPLLAGAAIAIVAFIVIVAGVVQP